MMRRKVVAPRMLEDDMVLSSNASSAAPVIFTCWLHDDKGRRTERCVERGFGGRDPGKIKLSIRALPCCLTLVDEPFCGPVLAELRRTGLLRSCSIVFSTPHQRYRTGSNSIRCACSSLLHVCSPRSSFLRSTPPRSREIFAASRPGLRRVVTPPASSK